jgi:hypothetical protein
MQPLCGFSRIATLASGRPIESLGVVELGADDRSSGRACIRPFCGDARLPTTRFVLLCCARCLVLVEHSCTSTAVGETRGDRRSPVAPSRRDPLRIRSVSWLRIGPIAGFVARSHAGNLKPRSTTAASGPLQGARFNAGARRATTAGSPSPRTGRSNGGVPAHRLLTRGAPDQPPPTRAVRHGARRGSAGTR